jgi:hypothetical protein
MFDDIGHNVELLFHIADQLELRAAAVEVVILAMDLVIGITLQVICQEAHTTLKGHENGGERQLLDFPGG